MYECKCGKEYKMKFHYEKHIASCSEYTSLEDETALDEQSIVEVVKEAPSLVGEICNYYEGHPRRLIKLQGLLSRTFDNKERVKIMTMINGM